MPENYDQYLKRIAVPERKCKNCEGKGRIYAIICEYCGGFCDAIKDGARRKEIKIRNEKEVKLEYTEAICQDCGAKGCWLFDWFDCDECNSKGYV